MLDRKESGPTEKHSSEPAGSALVGETLVLSGRSHGLFMVTALGAHSSEESPGKFFPLSEGDLSTVLRACEREGKPAS